MCAYSIEIQYRDTHDVCIQYRDTHDVCMCGVYTV